MHEQLRAVAFHEAGHAVVCAALGGVVRSVEIAPRPHAHCFHRNRADKATVALAGHLAEARSDPRATWGAGADFKLAWDAAELGNRPPLDQLQVYLDRAQALLDRHWLQVEVLAAALVQRKQLSGRGLELVFRSAQCCR